MQTQLNKRILWLYWLVLLVHLVFQYYTLSYRAITKPLLVPLLLTFLLLNDGNIGKPAGKAIFYIGLFLAFFGDVLLILINDTFFLAGMIAFMLMNIFYSTSFLHLESLKWKRSAPFFITVILLSIIAFCMYRFLAEGMGDYRMPVMIYLFSLIFMVACAMNIIGNPQHRQLALRFLIPGAVIFMIENILVAYNLFHWEANKDVYIIIMATYGTAQYLIVMGMSRAFPVVGWRDK